jgi:hypothetical protein
MEGFIGASGVGDERPVGWRYEAPGSVTEVLVITTTGRYIFDEDGYCLVAGMLYPIPGKATT